MCVFTALQPCWPSRCSFPWWGATALLQAVQTWAGRRGSSAEAVLRVPVWREKLAGCLSCPSALQHMLARGQNHRIVEYIGRDVQGLLWGESTSWARGSQVAAFLAVAGCSFLAGSSQGCLSATGVGNLTWRAFRCLLGRLVTVREKSDL